VTVRQVRARWGRRLLLVVGSFLVSFALCEALLRLLWVNPYRRELADVVIPLALHHRNKEQSIARAAVVPEAPISWLRTDERGYLLPARRFADPDATIVFLGGSTTECAAVTEEVRFPVLVSALLEERGLEVNTLNAAHSGNTTQDSLNVLLNHVVEDRPDAVVMMHAANDAGVLSQDGSYRTRMGVPLSSAFALRWALQAASAHVDFVGALRPVLSVGPLAPRDFAKEGPARPQQDWVAVSPDEYVRRLRAFVGICRAFGIEPVLMTQPLAFQTPQTPPWVDPRTQEVFNRAIRAVASDESVPLIDLVRFLSEEVEGWDRPRRVFYDGIHVNDAGSRLYAGLIAQRLLETVLASERRDLTDASQRSR
jgi:lysophospholipase L1-like esterase